LEHPLCSPILAVANNATYMAGKFLFPKI